MGNFINTSTSGFLRVLVFTGFIISLGSATLLFGQRVDTYAIHSIEIQRQNIFPGDSALGFFQSTLNKAHPITREEVIRRELLMDEGDTLDLQLIAETERNLRKFDFLGGASIEVDTLNNHEVALKVTTADQWSLVPAFIAQSGGGLIGLGASLEESNFLGWGKSLYAEYYNENDVGGTWTFAYYDPRLFGTRLRSSVGYSTGPLNKTFYFSIFKPFYASDVKWTYGLDLQLDDEIQRLFQDGTEASRVLLKTDEIKADVGYAFGKRYQKKRVSLKYRYQLRDFSDLGEATTTPVPEDEVISALTVGFSVEKLTFAKEKRIDKFKRTEDLTLGRKSSVEIGRAGFPVPVGVKRWEVAMSHRHAFQFHPNHYFFLKAAFETWVEKNSVLRWSSQYYWQAAKWTTIALNADIDYGWDLEEHLQFVLGGENGLRGYKARAFGGDRRALFNLESRFFPPLSLLTISLGTVAFMDAGYAWSRDEAFDFRDLRYSAGVGFRFGLTKSPGSPVVRCDFGWPINEQGSMQITFGLDQHFRISK